MTDRQHAPSPDYSMSEQPNCYPLIATCPSCGDYHLDIREADPASPRPRRAWFDAKCETCKQYDADDLAATKRALLAAIIRHPGIAHAPLAFNRSPDYHEIMCECGEESGLTYQGAADPLDGVRGVCSSCGTHGHISVDYDNEQASIRFVAGRR